MFALAWIGLGSVVFGNADAQQMGLIEAGNQELRDDLQWLIDRNIVDISVSTWPLPISALEKALEGRRKTNLTRADVNAILAVRRYLDDREHAVYGLNIQTNSGSIPQLGFASQSRGAAEVGAYVESENQYFAGRLQLNGLVDPITNKQSNGNLEGSYLSTTFWGQIFYVGQIAHYWGPGQDGSLNWGNSATAIPGLGLQRAQQTASESKWLSWLGPWGYDLFVGQLQHDTAVPDTKILNMRLFVRPMKGLELGASRFIEWGGDGRSNSIGTLWNALRGNSNDAGRTRDPSNELAGFDARYTLGVWGNPLTFYTQLAGEDEAGGLPSHYLSQVGVQFKNSIGSTRFQWHAEAADTTAERIFGLGKGLEGIAYSHTVYRSGLYEDGLPIGHSIGGSGRLLSAGVAVVPDDFRYYSRYGLTLMAAEVNTPNQSINEAFPKYARWLGAELSYSWRLRPASFRAGFSVLHRTAGEFDNAYSFMLSMDIPIGMRKE